MRNHNFKFRMYTGSKLMGKNSGAPIFAALFAGIAGSFAVLLVVIGVMNGFQDNYITRRVEIASYHASLMPIDNKQGCTYDKTIIDELYRQIPEIEAAVPFCDRDIIILFRNKIDSDRQPVKLRAVDPEELRKDSRFNELFNITHGSLDLSQDKIVLGEELGWRELSFARINSAVYLTPDISLQTLAGKKEKVFFRHKECGWKLFSLQLILADGMEHMQTLREDLYMRGFLADLYLRPSCHHCAFKGINRTADITLADFWGINRLMPDMDDDRGTSLIIIHSEKGQRLFNAVKSQLNYKAVSVDRAVAFNSAATQSAKPHPKRKDFFLRLENEAFPKLVSDCLYESPFTRAKDLIRRIARKLMRTLNFRRTP